MPRPLPLLIVLAAVFGALAAGPGAGSGATAQEPQTMLTPVGGPWTLAVHLGPDADPESVLAPLADWATAAFVFDAESQSFRSWRRGLPFASNLDTIRSGEAFWIFVPSERLDGDITFWDQPIGVRNQAAALVPGFNMVGWTGTDGIPVSQAVAGLPVEAAFLWDPVRQRYAIWNPSLPGSVSVDFELEYGAGLWLVLGGDDAVEWTQP